VRVAFVSFDFGEYCLRIANAMSQQVDVLLLLPEREVAPHSKLRSEAPNLKTFHKPRLREPLLQMRTVAALLRQIKNFNPDVIHLQSGHLWFNCALPFLRRYPLVLTMHDPYRHVGDKGALKTPAWILDLGSRHAAELIVHAPQLKEELLQRLGVPESRVHVIPHVLLGDDRAQKDIQEDDYQVLFFGRIWEYKGLDYLIRSEPLVSELVPNAKFVIAGEGEDFDRYRSQMKNPNRFVVYNEYISDEQRTELFRRSSVVVLPYIEASQSGVIPLAYRFGKPVVATNVGGLPAMVDDGRTGYLVPPRNETALADAIVRLLRNRELRHQLGANGKRMLENDCSPDLVARKTIAVYQNALKQATEIPTERAGLFSRLF
jgi:glycosyltransferase involved in cell wall biosynthesis